MRWIEPTGAWGPGRVELVQIPTPDETNDNIVAYWVPERLPDAEASRSSSRIACSWQKEARDASAVRRGSRRRAAVAATRSRRTRSVELHVDFEGPTLSRHAGHGHRERGGLRSTATARSWSSTCIATRSPEGWRFVVRFRRLDGGKPVELRAYLNDGDEVLSETWSYILPPG